VSKLWNNLRWFRIILLWLLFFAAFQFFAVIGWGSCNFALLAIVGVGAALVSPLLLVTSVTVVGIVLGWLMSGLRHSVCKASRVR
jgi:hypothetical protein